MKTHQCQEAGMHALPSLRRSLALLLPILAGGMLCCPAVFAQDSLPKSAGPSRAIPPHFFGVNIENSYANPVPSWSDPKLQRAIKLAGTQTVRFPGGDVGNYWDWQAGTVYPIGKAAKTDDTLKALAELAHATGTYPLYNLNVMTQDNAILTKTALPQAIANQLQMLDTARNLGLPVEEFELGNEFFWSSPDHDKAFPGAADYAAAMDEWTAQLKHAHPEAHIASVGSIPFTGDARTASWNSAVIGKVHNADAVTLHRYDSIVDGGIWDGTAPDAALGNVFTDWEKIVAGEVVPIEKARQKLWITEYAGLKDCTSNAHLTGTWLEGLYQAQMAVQFLSRASIDQIELYNISGTSGSLVFQNTTAYWDACLNKNITFHATPGDLTATGQAYALFGAALRHAEHATPIAFPQVPPVHPKTGAPYPAVTGIALTGHGNQWILLNLSPKPVKLQYPGMREGTMTTLNASSLTAMITSEHALNRSEHDFDGRAFTLPPYSISRIEAK